MAHVPMSVTNFESRPPSEESPTHHEGADIAAVRTALFDGEAVDRLFHGQQGGVQLLVVTNQRLIVVERAVWDGRTSMTSVPFSRISALSFLADDDRLDLGRTIGFRVMTMVFELRLADAEEAWEAHDLISWAMLH